MTTFTARSAIDLIATTPYVLGFHPEDSLVLLTFGSAEPFHARVDIPLQPQEQEELATMLRGVVAQHDVRLVAVLLYSEDQAVAASLGTMLLSGFLFDGVEVVDVVRVDAERFYYVLEDDELGTAYDLSTHPFTAAQVYDGRAVHENRSTLADTLIGGDDEDATEVCLAATRCADQVIDDPVLKGDPPRWLAEQGRVLQRRVRRLIEAGDGISTADAGELLVATSLRPLRDVAWSEMSRSTASRHVELWRDLVRRSPHDLIPGPAGLLAFAAWLDGNGALAWCAVDRCLEIDPDHVLARQVAHALGNAVSPSTWRPIPEGELTAFRAGPLTFDEQRQAG